MARAQFSTVFNGIRRGLTVCLGYICVGWFLRFLDSSSTYLPVLNHLSPYHSLISRDSHWNKPSQPVIVRFIFPVHLYHQIRIEICYICPSRCFPGCPFHSWAIRLLLSQKHSFPVFSRPVGYWTFSCAPQCFYFHACFYVWWMHIHYPHFLLWFINLIGLQYSNDYLQYSNDCFSISTLSAVFQRLFTVFQRY